VTVTGWVTGSFHGYSSGTVALIPVIAFFGLGILTVGDFRALSWDVLFIMGGGLCLGRSIEVSGLADWLIARLPTEGAEVFVLAAVFGVIACVMSSTMSNTATANLIMPVVMGLSVTPLSPILIAVAFACSLAMPLPISTPPNAMAFSTGEIGVKDILKTGLPITLIGLVLTFTLFYWWWGLIGVF
jgi:sodium-dependent dicarboxylate transporter 2/3/5